MKKILSIMLSLTLLLSMSVTAFAENVTSGSQTVSVNVPTPCYDYTLHIPADCEIKYNVTDLQSIGTVTVTSDYWGNITTDYWGVLVYVQYGDFLSNDKGDSKIFCGIGTYDGNGNFNPEDGDGSGWAIGYKEDGAGVDGRGKLYMEVPNWSNAQPGESYSVTITYTSELCVRH